LSAVRLFSLMELELKAVAEIKYIWFQRFFGYGWRRSNPCKNDQEFFLVVFCFCEYIYIPSPLSPPFGKGRGLVADRACSKLSAVRLFSLMELELKAVAEIKYIWFQRYFGYGWRRSNPSDFYTTFLSLHTICTQKHLIEVALFIYR
jgi:hypothetical protein